MSGVLPDGQTKVADAMSEKEKSKKAEAKETNEKGDETGHGKEKGSGDGKDEKEAGKKGKKNGGGYKNNYNKPRRPRVDFTADVGVGRQYTSFEFGQPQPGYNFGGYSYGYPQQPRYQGGGYRKYNQNPVNRAPPPPLALPEVVDVPLDVDTDDYKVDQAEMICFFGKEHFLSNMHIAPFILDGTEYRSIEHYYQANKLYMLAGEQYSAHISKIPNPGMTKKYTKQLLNSIGRTDQEIEAWKKKHSLAILKVAIKQKFLQHKLLCEQLLATGDSILVHTYDRDNFYASGCNDEAVKEWAKENSGSILKIPVEIEKEENQKFCPLIGKGKNFLGVILMQVRKAIKTEREMADMVEKITVK
ncbi:hypothetical protein WR25_09571 isoform A [Diploscapter pachys]|uniref:NADAR domain-containing protein n=1 Tax=Diploscapter pachys TaxID=2018661 RepID=A0A2A2KX35_9BILA|nr:hypothetical protein WR25_09571 isoform A [Diploscapter pachys]